MSDKEQGNILEQRELQNELLKEQKQKEKLLKEDIQQAHDENKSDWIRALIGSEQVVKKAFKDKRVFSDADLITIAGHMVVVMTNRRTGQRAVEAQRTIQAQQQGRSGLVRPM
ncbi:hypothetical protein KAR91_62050 [Candidatus Pacearchaeota archaeon]|nr:hypothetical protein [Candidatus Pacearchaeota archaeon]